MPAGLPQRQPGGGPGLRQVFPINIPGAGAFTANAYLGIPYAKALRWQNPVAPDPWPTPFQATQFGNECPQTVTVTQDVCTFNTLWDSIGYQNSATWNRLLAEVNPSKKKPAH